MRIVVAFVCLFVLLGMAGPVWAQTTITGSLQGIVKDPKGAGLPGVTVAASSDALVARQTATVTDQRGMYRFPSLPPGTYVLETQMPGFNPVRQENVKVRLGQVLAVDLTLSVADVKEEITVIASAPVVSTVSNTVSTNFDQDFIGKQPLPRNFYNIIQSAPGVNLDYTGSSGSAMLAFGGTTESQNAFTLDGVNVADSGAGQHWVLPAIQWMQEIEIGGLGAAAEYGGYTGGIINGITKSGGNEFHGDVEYYYQPASWTSDNTSGSEDQKFKFSDLAVSVGGPVIKDKLWFFASGELWQQVTTPYGASDTSDRKVPRFLGKLTWQVDDNNKIMLMTEYDSVNHERRGIGQYVLPDASSKQEAPGVTFALHWESLLSRDYFASVKLTGYDGRDDFLPYHGWNTPGRVDEDSGFEWRNQAIREINHRHLVTLEGSLSIFRDDLFGMGESHTFKLGGNLERGNSSDDWRRNGGFTYFDDSSYCESLEDYFADPSCGAYYIERGYGEYRTAPEFSGHALYLQDSIRFDRLTVNPGFRYGTYLGGWQSGRGRDNVYEVHFLDPRLGFVWDVTGNSKSVLKAHWGRYHDKMYTYLFDREVSGNGTVPDQDCYWDEETGEYSDCDEPTVILAEMGKVDHPYVDELILTYEQQLRRDMVIGIDLIDRKFRNIMAMVNVNDDYSMIMSVPHPETGKAVPIYLLNSPPKFVLTTDNGAYRDFRSAVLRFEKRYADKWQMRSSLVWTDLDGNILKNNGYAGEFTDKNGMVNADGKMDYAFNEWEYKLMGAVDLPYGFQASGQFTYLSGWYWTPYARISGLSDYYNASTGRNINIVPRGSEKLPARQTLDLRLAWTTKLRKSMTLTASLEVFNVFNKDTVLDVYNRWGTYYIDDEEWVKRGNYKDPYQIEFPRQIRAGIRFGF